MKNLILIFVLFFTFPLFGVCKYPVDDNLTLAPSIPPPPPPPDEHTMFDVNTEGNGRGPFDPLPPPIYIKGYNPPPPDEYTMFDVITEGNGGEPFDPPPDEYSLINLLLNFTISFFISLLFYYLLFKFHNRNK